VRHSAAELGQQGAKLRLWAADLADQMAEEAEAFATYLENRNVRGDRRQRLAMATSEQEVARIGSQMAARRRDLTTSYAHGEHLPRMVDTPTAPPQPSPSSIGPSPTGPSSTGSSSVGSSSVGSSLLENAPADGHPLDWPD
jgi:hypothetical protein